MRKKIIKKILPRPIPKRYFTVKEAIFHRTVHVLLNHTPEQYAKFLTKLKAVNIVDTSEKEFNFDNFAGFSALVTVKDKPDEFIIFIKKFDWTIKDQGTLIHEIVHTIIKIWQSNNIPYNADTQEFLADSVANLYEDITRKLLVVAK